jgi:uncharacterized repeat protein (TIGR03803 family)
VLYSFGGGPTDGSQPVGSLIQGVDGNFYGTTGFGGNTNNSGTFFRITPTGIETLLYSFKGGTAGDGVYPNGSLIAGSDGNYYGTTNNGGAFGQTCGGCGTVFKVTPAGAETVLYSFGGSNRDGVNPNSGLVLGTDGNFYGTTGEGGAHIYGTAFRLTPTGVETVLYSFSSTDAEGFYPRAGLLLGSDGDLYGTTSSGGKNNNGTVFKITPTGVETVIYSLGTGITDGEDSVAALIQGTDGNLYGTTQYGGNINNGVVFKLTDAMPAP